MKLVEPGYKILTLDGKPITRRKGTQILQFLERIARTCYKSEDKIGKGTAEKLVKALIHRGHEAMLEFYDIVVLWTMDRGVSHELVRHRVGSYAQESTRYCNYGKKGEVTFIKPPWVKFDAGSYTQHQLSRILESNERPNGCSYFADAVWLCSMMNSERAYLDLISQGWSPQQARSVLPNSLKTEIVSKFNIREWRHIFRLRTAEAAYPQMQEVMRPLLADFRKSIPVLFDDVGLV